MEITELAYKIAWHSALGMWSALYRFFAVIGFHPLWGLCIYYISLSTGAHSSVQRCREGSCVLLASVARAPALLLAGHIGLL